MALMPKRAQDDNVESVDMEMSSEEEIEMEAPKSSVSFSLTPQKKPLLESPLLEKEEPKVKKLLNVTITPPPRLPEPPPLPDVDEIFPELKTAEESEEVVAAKCPSPPLPPLPPPMPIHTIVHEVPVLNPVYPPPRIRGYFSPRFNNQRQRFSPWQNNNNMRPQNNNNMRPQNNSNIRPRQPPMTGPRFRPDGNFRNRPPWFRGNQRPPRFAGCRGSFSENSIDN